MPFLATFVSLKRRQGHRRRRTQAAADGSTANSGSKRKSSPCWHGEKSGGAKKTRSCLTLDKLPQDVLQKILALLPMKDATITACVSRELLQSWRCYPELEFSTKTLSLNEQHTSVRGQKAKEILNRIDGILTNRSGAWVKRLKFELRFLRKVPTKYIDRWVEAAALGVEELTLALPRDGKEKYRFPCKLFSDEKGCSIQSLRLSACAFHPDLGSSHFRNLKRMHFSWVHINTEEIDSFLPNSLALEHLEFCHCHEIASLKLPRMLQRLSFLQVERCDMLQMVKSDAPSLSTFHYEGPILPFLFGDSQQLTDVKISVYPWQNLFKHARTVLPQIVPNLETLFLISAYEVGTFYSSSLMPGKFLHLKYLELVIVGPRPQVHLDSEYLSLVHFLISSPALETFILHVEGSTIVDPLLADVPSILNRAPRFHHKNIKHVTITGFCPTYNLIELIFYILENAVSLQSLTLDRQICGFEKDLVADISQDTNTRDFKEWQNFVGNEDILWYTRRVSSDSDWEAYVSHKYIISYIVGRVPCSVELKILGTPPAEVILSLEEREKEWDRVVCPRWKNYISSLRNSS